MPNVQIHEFETDKRLICRFAEHEFELDRNTADGFSFGNWYMFVTDDEGEIASDGWIDDSSSYTARQAMIHACTGALIDPPTTWPDEI